MRVVIFAGPTLGQKDVESLIDCTCLPPVKHGDVIRILAQKPAAIGIIDGYFEGAAAVWHKEILYALDQGVHVYGSSSMGALRAAELHPFGMIGIGQVFEWYRDGVVTDDDEVAVLHGPEEVSFIAASVPLVNIRASLALACEQGVVNSTQVGSLLAAAKKTFYKQRNWNRLLDESIEMFGDRQLTERLKIWLEHSVVDQKQRDAIQMLKVMQGNSVKHAASFQACSYFEWTDVWDSAYKRYNRIGAENCRVSPIDQRVLGELSLNPELFERYRDKALLGSLLSDSFHVQTDDTDLKKALFRFRDNAALYSRTQVLEYMSRVTLDEPRLMTLLQAAAQIEQLKQAVPDLMARIIDQLKLDGRYLDMLHTVEDKAGVSHVTAGNSEQSGVLQRRILAWYFENRLGYPIPQSLEDHIKKTAFNSVEEFYSAINLDFAYHNSGVS